LAFLRGILVPSKILPSEVRSLPLKHKAGFNRRFGLAPGIIALLYAGFSILWIWVTDMIVNAIEDPRLRLFLATSKGAGFVLITAISLYLMMRKLVNQTIGAQHSLAASEAEYRGVLEAANEGVCRLTKEDRIGFVNPRMAALLHRNAEDLIGLPLSDFLDAADRTAFAEQLSRWRNGATEQQDFCFRGVDGGEIRTIVSGTPVFDPHSRYSGCVLMLMDITERQRIQEQLQQSQKLEAVGRFAGGIAHDFNNILGIIIGYATLLKARLREDEKGKAQAALVLLACERAAALVKQLLGFSRKQPLVLTVIDLNTTVTNFGRMLPRVIGEDVRITVRSDTPPATIRTDPVLIEQVLMNLAVNARDAMPTGGELLIETGRIHASSIFGIKDIPPGLYCYLQVTDSGIGMNADVRSRIFEPFFTTKEVGKGTGLGLSMVYGIVKQSGGFIAVMSQPKQGTRFSIYFPFANAEQQQAAEPLERVHPSPHGNETILLVEDEKDLRTVTKHILMQHGYRIIEATDGLEALAICQMQLPQIDLIVTDLVMPHMGGRELASRLTDLKPTLKIVFVSGYADDSFLGDTAKDYITIEKPISPEVLVRRIRQILDSGGEIRATA
jgi:two-component system cell cycle sensor histidine kinase/response regulator CckA